MEKTIPISTPFIRLDAALKFSDIVQSGGEAKLMIQDGQVSLNGEVCTMRGKKCVAGDRITVDHVTISITGDQS